MDYLDKLENLKAVPPTRTMKDGQLFTLSKNLIESYKKYISINFHSFNSDSFTINPNRLGIVSEHSQTALQGRLETIIENTKSSPTFSDFLIEKQNQLGLKAPEVYKAAGIDFRHYSKIISDRNYKPKRDTVFALAIALRLDIKSTEQFLKYAGFTFNPSNLFDMTIKFFLDEKIYDRVQIDVLMESLNLPLLPQNW